MKRTGFMEPASPALLREAHMLCWLELGDYEHGMSDGSLVTFMRGYNPSLIENFFQKYEESQRDG